MFNVQYDHLNYNDQLFSEVLPKVKTILFLLLDPCL
jgi:hypothetical protein